MVDLEKCKDEFLKYTEKYDLNNDNLKRKSITLFKSYAKK